MRRVAGLAIVLFICGIIAIPISKPANGFGSGLSDCDPLVPEYCTYPFPNNFFLRTDASTPTGYRVRLTYRSLPVSNDNVVLNETRLGVDELDGFPVYSPISALFADLSIDNFPRHWDISRSLSADCPSVLIDTTTGEILPNWAELDMASPDATRAQQSLMIWPVKTLDFNRRYIVALRNMKTTAGLDVTPSRAFLALRDNIPTQDPDIELRRSLFEDIFQRLERVGVSRESLQLAWDFTTASKSGTQTRMLTVIEDGLRRLPAGGPKYEITSVRDDFSNYIARYILGNFEVPIYTNRPGPGSKLVVDANGKPVYQQQGTALFSMLIPRSVAEGRLAPQGIVQFGHGLFQSRTVILTEDLQKIADMKGYIVFATEFWGLCVYDLPFVEDIVSTDMSDINVIPDRSVQGMLNQLSLMKMVTGDFVNDPVVQYNGKTVIIPEKRFYAGVSLGGIYGCVYMSLTQDVDKGSLGVPGSSFAQMLPRSTDFTPFWSIISRRYQNPVDRIQLLSLMQMLWDRSEPSGFYDLIRASEKRVQVLYALGDSQVTYMGSYTMIRSIGAKHFPNYTPARKNETMFGFEYLASSSTTENTAIVYDFGSPEVPIYNIPGDKAYNTHVAIFGTKTYADRLDTWYQSGIQHQVCEGVCGPDPQQLH
eukprot:TRINITY_DN2449_c0_g1_i1.p1 TRINITY_DN2449_c0_g1~~TRINITY_DN2449_c0_g1_i1.p1  ORF type:complete len:651 (-),score=98.84 TRINITY_DN2449_c0_g1_i1:88-2040(-)